MDCDVRHSYLSIVSRALLESKLMLLSAWDHTDKHQEASHKNSPQFDMQDGLVVGGVCSRRNDSQ